MTIGIGRKVTAPSRVKHLISFAGSGKKVRCTIGVVRLCGNGTLSLLRSLPPSRMYATLRTCLSCMISESGWCFFRKLSTSYITREGLIVIVSVSSFLSIFVTYPVEWLLPVSSRFLGVYQRFSPTGLVCSRTIYSSVCPISETAHTGIVDSPVSRTGVPHSGSSFSVSAVFFSHVCFVGQYE